MIPKTAQCDKHPNRIAVAKFNYELNGEKKLERVCLNCGDIWWQTQPKTVRDTLRIEELTKEDLKNEA